MGFGTPRYGATATANGGNMSPALPTAGDAPVTGELIIVRLSSKDSVSLSVENFTLGRDTVRASNHRSAWWWRRRRDRGRHADDHPQRRQLGGRVDGGLLGRRPG